MKRYIVIIGIMALVSYILGCGKKKDTLSQMQEPMSIEALSTVGSEAASVEASKVAVEQQKAAMPVDSGVTATPVNLEPLPPQVNYKPTITEIQTALKNAGLYTGLIDGKSGPMTKKAIQEFQKVKGLKVDGKVGPKTWSVLSVYLKPLADAQDSSKKR